MIGKRVERVPLPVHFLFGHFSFSLFFFFLFFSFASGTTTTHWVREWVVLCVCVCVDERKRKKKRKKKEKKKERASWIGQPNKLISALLEIFPSQRRFIVVGVRVLWVPVERTFCEISGCEGCGTEIGNFGKARAPHVWARQPVRDTSLASFHRT